MMFLSEKIKCFVANTSIWQYAVVGIVTAFVMKRMLSTRSRIYKKYTALGKTILITGANSGIGRAAAVEFAKRGARVILACRDRDKAVDAAYFIREKTTKGSLVLKQVDLASLRSVSQFATNMLETEEKIDVMINNAGVLGLPYSLTEDGIETTFQVNHLGHFLLTNLLLKLIKKAENGRIIVVSSLLYKSSQLNFDEMNVESGAGYTYGQSKLANLLFAHQLAANLRHTHTDISVNSMSPGMVKTGLARNVIQNSWWKTLLYATVGRLFLSSAEEGCETIVFCALDPSLSGVTGKFFRNCQPHELLPNATDSQAALELWSKSQIMCENFLQEALPSDIQDKF